MSRVKTEKLLRVKNRQGHTVRVVRELYLREDIPCNSRRCLAGCQHLDNYSLLPENAPYYIFPDSQVTKDFIEILEFPEISGIVFTQTVCNIVQKKGGRRLYQKVNNIVKDQRRGSVVFHNEFQKYAACPRHAGEDADQWQARSTYQAAEWYYNHLAGQVPVIMLTQDKQFIDDNGYKTENVFVLSVNDFLKTFWPNLKAAHDLLDSLTASLQETQSKHEGKDFSGYLSEEILEAGLKSGRFIQGCLQVNKHNSQREAFVRRTNSVGVKDEMEEHSEVLISGMMCRNRSVHGDNVVVELLPRSEWKGKITALSESGDDAKEIDQSQAMPTGKVVGIIQRNWRDYVASFSSDEITAGSQNKGSRKLVIPFDHRIPKIRISTRQADTLKDHRIVVRIDSWDVDSQYPNGHFVRTLGKSGELETEIAAILVEYDLSVGPFSEGILKEMPTNTPSEPWTMDPEEVTSRRDLRDSHLIFSIDPKGCEDVDDTLSVRKLPNGGVELGVHIADVSYFVLPNSLTDLEARSRCTTVYLADRRYDMLPGILSADLCSLISGVDRYAMSVIWEFDKNYNVQDIWYGRTVIRSQYKLFYEMAQAIHDGASDADIIENVPELQNCSSIFKQQKSIKELREAINSLMNIARNLKAKRLVDGALELEGSEVQVRLDDTRQVENLIPKQPLEVHETIAECMIFANYWVAKKIYDVFPHQSLLRHHPLPRQEQFDTLKDCAKSRGFDILTSSNKNLASSLDKAVDQSDPVVNKLLRTLATLAMSQASYFCTGSLNRDQFFHYGLALDYYTHFTSPIRRYADVIVHRLLLACVSDSGNKALLGNKELTELSSHINTKHRSSQHAQRDSQELFQSLYFKDRPPGDPACTVDAVIFQLRSNGFLVFIPRYSIKGAVYLEKKSGEVLHVNKQDKAEWVSGSLSKTDTSMIVNSSRGSQTYNIFDHVTVKIYLSESHAHRSSLKFDLVAKQAYRPDEEFEKGLQTRTDIVKEVGVVIEERLETENEEDLPYKNSEYSQSQNSLYTIFESFKLNSLKTSPAGTDNTIHNKNYD